MLQLLICESGKVGIIGDELLGAIGTKRVVYVGGLALWL